MRDAWRYSMTTLKAKIQELDPISEKKKMHKPLTEEEQQKANTVNTLNHMMDDMIESGQKKSKIAMPIMQRLVEKANQ